MKRTMTLAAVAAALFLLSMGGMGGSDDAVPTPDRNFHATITDKANVVTRAEYLACDGKTNLRAERGKAVVTIPFEKIRSVEFRDGEKDAQQATVLLNDGTTHQVSVRNGEKCTGTTDLGGMSIHVKDLLRVVFEPDQKPAAPKEPAR